MMPSADAAETDAPTLPQSSSSVGVLPGPPLDFNTAEAELREIDLDFAAGRLSAFGSGGAYDDIQRELKKVADLEVQVFIRCSAQLRSLHDEEQLLQKAMRNMTAVEQPSPSAAAEAAPDSDADPDSGARGPSRAQQSPWNSLGGTDKAFENISKVFRMKEASLKSVSENMRQMAKHVAASNEALLQAHTLSSVP